MDQNRYARDLLQDIFYQFPQGQVLWHYDKQEFHGFFAEARETYPELGDHLQFYTSTDGLHAPSLEEALSELRSMRLLRSWGSSFNPQEFIRMHPKPDAKFELVALSTAFQERFAQNISTSSRSDSL